jgi:hypothetical protein
MAALQISNDREVEYGAAFALASSGNVSQAQTLADDMERRFSEDTSVRFNYLPVLRARLALSAGNASKALEILQVAAPHELGAHRSSMNGLFGALYPVYVRGEAYLATGQGREAATRVPENSRSPRNRGQRSHRSTGAPAVRPGLRFVGRYDQGEDCLPGFPHPLERRRSRHPHPQANQGGICQAAMSNEYQPVRNIAILLGPDNGRTGLAPL